MPALRYLTLEEILYLHDRIIRRTSGRGGIRDLGLLESAVYRPASTFGGEDLYPDVFSKAAAIIHSLVNKHAFADGNKRTAYATGVRYLLVNGYHLRASSKSVIRMLLDVEAKRLSFDDLAGWLKTHAHRD